MFVGEPWDADSQHKQLRSLLLDLVRGQDVTGINLASLDHVISFTASMDKVPFTTSTDRLYHPSTRAPSPTSKM